MALDLIRTVCALAEAAVEEDHGEVELTLGLSVGGSSRKAPGAVEALQGLATDARSREAEADLGGSASSPSTSPRLPTPLPHVDGKDAMELTRRREIHALRRWEARRKWDEKKQQQRKGICRAATVAPGLCGVLPSPERTWSRDDRLATEAREHQVRAKDREARVEETLDRVPKHKLSANHNSSPGDGADSNSTFNPNYANPKLVPFGAQSFPMIAMQYSYPHLQYVPTANGFGIPCMMPCWASAVSPVAEGARTERNVFQPVACRAFQHIVVEPTDGDSPPSSKSAESNDGNGSGVQRAPPWAASQGSSSSPATSHRQGGSPRGGSRSSGSSNSSSSDGRTCRTQLPQPSLQQATILPPGQSDNSTSSRQVAPYLGAAGEPPSERRPIHCANRRSPANESVSASGDSGPPRLPGMPCVSATGNGPNGRTITGVLYRYTETEVSIVCACHGSSFSPVEFVEHAGGTDVTHPLRQITVVSS